MTRCNNANGWTGWAAAVLLMAMAGAARAVQVQDLVRLKGAEGSKLVGMGLVVGLKGTGDGGKFLPAMRPLAEVVGRLIDPNTVAAELADAKNVALVALTADLPAAGVREGDRVDVHVSAVGPAKSLEGGRLFLIPLTGPLPGSPIYAFAEGPITIENAAVPTVGVVPKGAQLTRDVMSQCLDEFGRITLVLNEANATWPMAKNIADVINGWMSPDGPNLAKAVDPRNVVVQVPIYNQQDPAVFISQILQTYIDPSQVVTGARVVINERTGTIVMTGDVQISPVIIAHNGLTITTITPPPGQVAPAPAVTEASFIALDPERRAGAGLADLLAALNQLKVPSEDRIQIIKLLHESGKLHAQLIIE
ncbi:MAG TPA: flagellar basal body P-ring protein FlgI [Phycisphaeraceae bacterium]